MPDRQDHVKRIIFFERLYFLLDLDGDGAVPIIEVDRFLTFAAYDLSREERRWRIANSLNVRVTSDEFDALGHRDKAKLISINRREFVQLCVSALLERDMEELELAAETFWRAQKSISGRAEKRWRRVSHLIDIYCRVVFSTVYFSALCCILLMNSGEHGTQLTDERQYADLQAATASQLSSDPPFRLQGVGVWLGLSLIVPLLLLAALGAWAYLRWHVNRRVRHVAAASVAAAMKCSAPPSSAADGGRVMDDGDLAMNLREHVSMADSEGGEDGSEMAAQRVRPILKLQEGFQKRLPLPLLQSIHKAQQAQQRSIVIERHPSLTNLRRVDVRNAVSTFEQQDGGGGRLSRRQTIDKRHKASRQQGGGGMKTTASMATTTSAEGGLGEA